MDDIFDVNSQITAEERDRVIADANAVIERKAAEALVKKNAEIAAQEALEEQEFLKDATIEQMEERYSVKTEYDPLFPHLFKGQNGSVADITDQQEAKELLEAGVIKAL